MCSPTPGKKRIEAPSHTRARMRSNLHALSIISCYSTDGADSGTCVLLYVDLRKKQLVLCFYVRWIYRTEQRAAARNSKYKTKNNEVSKISTAFQSTRRSRTDQNSALLPKCLKIRPRAPVLCVLARYTRRVEPRRVYLGRCTVRLALEGHCCVDAGDAFLLLV